MRVGRNRKWIARVKGSKRVIVMHCGSPVDALDRFEVWFIIRNYKGTVGCPGKWQNDQMQPISIDPPTPITSLNSSPEPPRARLRFPPESWRAVRARRLRAGPSSLQYPESEVEDALAAVLLRCLRTGWGGPEQSRNRDEFAGPAKLRSSPKTREISNLRSVRKHRTETAQARSSR